MQQNHNHDPNLKKIGSLLGFAFVNDADQVTAVSNAYKSGPEMIQKMQAPMPELCWCICAIGCLIVPAKTRWYLVLFSEMVITGSTKQKILYPAILLSPTKMENGILHPGKSLQQPLNFWA